MAQVGFTLWAVGTTPTQWAHSTQSILRWITSKRRDGTGSTDTCSMRSRTRSHSGDSWEWAEPSEEQQQFISSRWRCARFKCTDYLCRTDLFEYSNGLIFKSSWFPPPPFVSRQSAGAQRSKKRRTQWFLWPNARVTSVFLWSAALE